MMSLAAIDHENQKAARKARRSRKQPYVYGSPEDILTPFPFPYLGTTEWSGWEYTGEQWFVDSSGFGTDNEPALSQGQFRKALREYVTANPGVGFAVISAGQFQVYVGAFKRR